jgi:mono/diheme cytochrome c family protein
MNIQAIGRLCRHVLGIGLALAWAHTHAATMDSTPTFNDPVLTIPRIDVEGYGALTLQLRMEDAQSMIFVISSANPAALGFSPGATYSLQTETLSIPVVRVGTSLYAVQLQLLPGEKFQVSSAVQTQLPGQEKYTQQCQGCHGSDGLGGAVGVTLKDCGNCASVDSLVAKINNSMPLGSALSCVDACASEIAHYILTVFNASSVPSDGLALAALSVMSPSATLQAASMQLLSRTPTQDEFDLVASQGEEGLRAVLKAMMEEPRFYVRLSEIFNDWLHTNRYLASNGPEAALQLMRRYPNARWFDPGEALRDSNYQFNRITTNNSVATEPLELINYVVKNDLPMTNILTADYFMVNGYSAKSYGINNITFADEWDPSEFHPAVLPGLPHAGILSSLMFLNRYPTSATNRNRARSRVVYDLFLDVDILALDGVRPDGSAVDISSTAPTLENPDCVKCHSLLDPVASSFQSWNLAGRFAPQRSWYTDMFQAGFAASVFPVNSGQEPLQWLSEEIVADARFDTAIVRLVYTGLTGHEPLDPPDSDATTAEQQAYAAESELLGTIKATYVADNRKLKTLVSELVMSPYWRAQGLMDASYAFVHQETGAARLLTPEMLHRKIAALFGFEWRGPLDQYAQALSVPRSARLLDTRQYFHQIYGGIDSFAIPERLTNTNGLMVLVQERMANEMACYAVPQDFLSTKAERRLFPLVEMSTQINSDANQMAVRQNIQYLHRYLLGEELALDDPEIERSYMLFAAVQVEGKAKIGSTESKSLPSQCMRNKDMMTGASLSSGGIDARLRDDPDYVLRAWMAVIAYLLTDYRFLYA